MAGNYDRFWSRSKGTRSQFRLEGLQPFKCTYPVHLTDIMDVGQSSQSNSQRTEFSSPFKETQTKAVREYEETISQLKKENFDLKLRLYLTEKAHKETYHVRGSNNDEKEDCIQVIVNLRIEAKELKKELNGRDEELQNAVSKSSAEVEKYKTELEEAQQKIKEQQEYLAILEQLPTPDDYKEVRRQYSAMVRDGEHTRQLLAEKDQLLAEKYEEIEKLQKEIAVFSKKVKQRDEAIRACAMKFHKEVEHIPKELRPVIKSAIEAAVNKDEKELISSLEVLKRSLSEIMGAPISSFLHSTYLEDSHKQSSSSSRSSGSCQSLPTSNASGSDKGQLSDSFLEGDLDPAEIAASNASVCYSDKASQCDSINGLDISNTSATDVETIANLRSENEILMKDVSEKLKIIESLSAAHSEIEEREQELNAKLDEAYTKIDSLEDELEMKQNLVTKEIKRSDSSSQTDISWNSLQSSISDKNLQEFGTSNNNSELKEEILMLILAIEQKDKELSDLLQKSTMSHESMLTPADENYAAERYELQQRLASSCDINNKLLKHLKSLERFMEDLLQQKNLSSSSMENINESADFFSRISDCFNESVQLSQHLSDQLSICEELNDTTMRTGIFNESQRNSISHISSSHGGLEKEPEGRRNFYPPVKENQNVLGSGVLNLADIYSSQKLQSFTRKKQTTDSLVTNTDNVVVLKTSNNEDLILLLNDQGDPEDVLIRNNGVLSNNSDQHRRRCWDTPTNDDIWSSEKFAAQCKENVYNVENSNVFKPNYMRYNTWASSDSDTWSEPDRIVSMQRIGIDVQTSPITRSPRKSSFKDRRAAEDSTKNETASSYVKLHTFSKRRRSSETSKTSLPCKKCQKLSQQLDDTLKEENVHLQELQQLHDENSHQQIEIENLTEMLKKKEKVIETLDEEKSALLNDIDDLKEKLTQQQRNNALLITRQNESLSKLEEKDSLNKELQDIIDRLEINVKDSDAECEKLQTELNQTKERLALLDKQCAKYEYTLSTCSKDETDNLEKISALEKRETELLQTIKDMTLQKNSLLDKLKEEEKRAEELTNENLEMTEKIRIINQEILQLQNSNEELEKQNASLINAKTSSEKYMIAFNSQKEKLMSEIKSLRQSNEEHERQNASLLNAKTSSERDLMVLNSEKEKFMSEIESLKEQIQSLESDCDSFEAKIDSLTDSKQNILDFLSNFESSFANNLNALDDACNVKVDLNANDVGVAEEMSYLVNEDEGIKTLLKNIVVENLKFKKLASGIFQQMKNVQIIKQTAEEEKHKSSSLKHKIMLKEEEIKTLHEEIDRLRSLDNEIYELQSAAETYKADRELLEKYKKLLAQKENSLRSLEKKNLQFEETIKILQNEKLSNEQNLKSANFEISSLQKCLLAETSREKLESALDSKQKEIVKLQEQIHAEEMTRGKSEHELMQRQKSLLDDIRNLKGKNQELEELIQVLQNDRKKFEQSFESANEEMSALQECFMATSEDYKNSLDLKQKEIDKLQEHISALQSQIDALLSEKRNWTRKSPSKETPEKVVSPDSSTIIEISSKSILQSASQSFVSSDTSCSSIQSFKSDEIALSSTVKKDREKYMKFIKSLQRKLEAADNRIEVLEKEKNSMRENLLSYVHGGRRTSSGKAEEEDSKVNKITELESEMQKKQSFIQDLKSDLYKAHDSLIDKQKEIDKLKQELLKLKKLNEDSARTQHQLESRFSDALMTEANINDLRERKKELVNLLLDLQRQFYEAKNIHLNHFEKFTQHIENLRALQVSPSMPKSESAPLLNSSSTLITEQSRRWDKTFKNVQIDMEIDVEFMQNFKIFLTRFFSMCQSSSSETKIDRALLQAESSKAVCSKDTAELSMRNISSSVQQQVERLEPSHDRLATTACAISIKLDSIESMLRTVIDEFEELGDMAPTIDETSRETAAKLVLMKLFDGLESFLENANEIFFMNSRLKSLQLFDSDLHCGNSKQDISDHESLLSEETIALSRSTSLSPVSFDGQFAVSAVHQKFAERALVHSYIKQNDENKQSSLRPSHKVIFGSQDSVFQRSHYSSPDLGIESDPNHEHSAPEQADKFHSTKISTSRHDLSGSAAFRNLDKQRLSSIYGFNDSSFKMKDQSLPFAISDSLHAIGHLQDFELLKKEISECIVGIKSILSRTGDGMQHIANNQSPRKLQNLEYSTFKAIKDTCLNIDACLQKANKLVTNFWVATCPTEDELRLLLQKNEGLSSKLKRTLDLKKKQELDFKDVLDRLKQAEAVKEKQEQKISKKLVKTKKVLRLAEKKIIETKNQELPLLFKRSSKHTSNQL